ncbi:cobyric acid synthase [Anaerocolumna sedimenticola]|uniref:Cobyric acid synthase n=1 Tax=Anaerocolumna sedimenticola TaxID=2696063 RepID=A0A6P1TJ80_9FIRM|nr:cobyric acid synthase [Anaerocolumna sedimenticola]QHQ61260.1 cobyric acid synthase [Anaerocolumna sedimenticola]
MAKAIMIQGTMSNVGKSLLVAGLCRVLKQDGYRVAPFKSQNMALNSFITEEGLEMGRAQVMQAEACGIKPSVLMNPILLKPTTDVGSQVIVNGEVLGNMKAMDYFKYKKSLIPDIMKAYHKLEEEYDIIVIEGAGSPAEINLKSDDIVNMGMAKLVDAPVLLVGDIDRGGVFAQLVGTLMLLEEEEKARVKGTIINKFRGDKTILEPGLAMLKEISGKEVAGVIPYLYLDIDDEDSLSERFISNKAAGLVDIAVIKLPRISNFTDFNSLEHMEGVTLRYVTNAADLKDADMIILPGTKSTMSDLNWMRQNGLEAAIKKQAAKGKIIFGICGGYQMLGEKLSDPYDVEASGSMEGIGLLPIETVFDKEKVRTRVSGNIADMDGIFRLLSGIRIEGYEIHMGVSNKTGGGSGNYFSLITDSVTEKTDQTLEENNYKSDGFVSENVLGTYVHGIFDREEFLEGIIKTLFKCKGLEYNQVKSVDLKAYKEMQYDKLADSVRKNMDMDFIYKILEEAK